MGLFGRDDRSQNNTALPQPEPKPQVARPKTAVAKPHGTTTIARACTFKGDLQSSGDVTVEGQFRGSIDTSAHLIIAESGRIEAKLHGRNVSIAGNVTGDITADERIELDPSAEVKGNIIAPRILIKDGATFEGQVFMKSPSKSEKDIKPKTEVKDTGSKKNGR